MRVYGFLFLPMIHSNTSQVNEFTRRSYHTHESKPIATPKCRHYVGRTPVPGAEHTPHLILNIIHPLYNIRTTPPCGLTTAASPQLLPADQPFSPSALYAARDTTRHHTATSPAHHITRTCTTATPLIQMICSFLIALDAHILTFPTDTVSTQLPMPPCTFPILHEHTAWHTA